MMGLPVTTMVGFPVETGVADEDMGDVVLVDGFQGDEEASEAPGVGGVASLMTKMIYLGVVVEVTEDLTVVGLRVLGAPGMIG